MTGHAHRTESVASNLGRIDIIYSRHDFIEIAVIGDAGICLMLEIQAAAAKEMAAKLAELAAAAYGPECRRRGKNK